MAMQAAFLAVLPHKRGRTLEGRRYVADYEDAGLGWTNGGFCFATALDIPGLIC